MKIAFAGAMSTGKTTMARWLAKELGCTLLPDISRELRILGLYPDKNSKKIEHYMYATWKQIRQELENDSFVADSALYTNLIYAISDSVTFTGELERVVSKFAKYDRVFYLPIEVPLETDSIRNVGPEYQEDIDTLYRNFLAHHKIKYIEVSGDLKSRQKRILNYVPKKK